MASNPFDKLAPQQFPVLPEDVHPSICQYLTMLANYAVNSRQAFVALKSQQTTTQKQTETVVQQFQAGGGGNVFGPSSSTPGDAAVFADASGKQLSDVGYPPGDATKVGVQEESYVFATDTGAANAYVISQSPTPTRVAGSFAAFIAAHANTGASTLSIDNGATSAAIKKESGGSLVDVAAGDIPAGGVIRVTFDGTVWQIPSGSVTFGGDLLSLTGTTQKVVGILNKAIDATTPTDGQIPQYQSATGKWELVYVYQKSQGGVAGQPAAGQPMCWANILQPVAFAANFAGSSGMIDPGVGTNPAATVTLTVKRWTSGVATTLGTISISTSGVFTFATTGGLVQSAGTNDLVAVYNQNPADASLAYPTFALAGYLGSTAPTAPVTLTGAVMWPAAFTGDDIMLGDADGIHGKDSGVKITTSSTSNVNTEVMTSAAAQTAFSGQGAIVDTSPEGYYLPAWNPSDGTSATSNGALVASNNQVLVTQFVLPFTITVRQIVFQCTNAVAASVTAIGIYDSSGNKLVAADNVSTAGTGTLVTAVTATVLKPGVYIIAQSTSSTSVQTTNLVTNANLNSMLNHNTTKRQGVAANAMSAGVLPATLGAITAALVYPVMTLLEP